MKNLNLAILSLACITLAICACKKEDIDAHEVVQKQLLGRWPLKYTIKTVYTNDVASTPDTTIYNPVDTLIFGEDGKMVRRNGTIITTIGYTIDATGENITFTANPPYTQKFSFVRNTSIGLVTENTVTVGPTTTRTVTEDQLIK